VLPRGVEANSIYTGYAPAAVLSAAAQASSGSGPYTYGWTAGGGLALAAGTANQPTAQVYATAGGNYAAVVTVTVTDSKGCSATATLTVHVVDVRSGRNGDKVNVCHGGGVLSIDKESVADHLAHGDALGSCPALFVTGSQQDRLGEMTGKLTLTASPNPSANYFVLQVKGESRPLRLRVTDILGRIVEENNHVAAHQSLRIGAAYRPGVYFVEVSDGSERTVVKLVKQVQ
jgi:hypothetical protein